MEGKNTSLIVGLGRVDLGPKTPSCGERYHFPTSFHVLAICIYRGSEDQYSKVKLKGATFASKFFSCAGNLASMSSKDGIFGPSAVSNDSPWF
jgi:hypothetical protein